MGDEAFYEQFKACTGPVGGRLDGALDATTSSVEEFVPARRECRKLLSILDEMGMMLVRRSYGRGEIVYRKGEQVGALYVVREGVVRIFAEYAGQAAGKPRLGSWGQWEVFGVVRPRRSPGARL